MILEKKDNTFRMLLLYEAFTCPALGKVDGLSDDAICMKYHVLKWNSKKYNRVIFLLFPFTGSGKYRGKTPARIFSFSSDYYV